MSFEGSITISVDEAQANILARLLNKEPLVPAEWRELIGVKEQITSSVELSKKHAQELNSNSALFSRYGG